MKNAKLNWILAVSASLTISGWAMGQYRIGSDGRAMDANNRIGSGGVNEMAPGAPASSYSNLGNNIVNGTVTGGQQFRGFIPYSAPTAFRGRLPGDLTDQFISESSGVPTAGNPNNNAEVVRPFYGTNSTVSAPPMGFVQQPNGQGYSPSAQALTQQPSDQRLGDTLDVPTTSLPPPGQLILPGQVDPSAQTSSFITASPLYGVREWNSGNAADQGFLNSNMGGQGQAGQVDPATLQKMRSELLQSGNSQDQSQNGNLNQNNSNTLDNGAGVPFESPLNKPLSNSVNASVNGQNSYGQAAGNLSTGATLTQQTLMSPQQQSKQYAELRNRLQQYRILNNNSGTGQTQNRQLALQQGQNATGTTPGSAIPNLPNTGAQPRTGADMSPAAGPNPTPSPVAQPTKPGEQPQNPQLPNAQTPPEANATGEKPKPLQVHSLAEGVQAKGLADLLKEAEDQMKAGRYNSALEQYDIAEQVAPNNPLILLGRADAELGQSYYTRADTHLRQAFTSDQALLMGQYDLNALLGQERLQFLVSDLKEISKREQKESRPLFLLAYIAYNTGNERKAAAYLDLAEKRAGGKDPVYDMVRKYWSLPSDAGQNQNDLLSK